MRPPKSWAFWVVNVGFWLLFAISNGLSTWADLKRRGVSVELPGLLRTYLVGFAPWMLITALVFALVRRVPIRRERWLAPLSIYFAVVVAGAAVYVPFDALLMLWIDGRPLGGWRRAIAQIPASIYFLEGLLAVGLFAFANAFDAFRLARERQARVAALALDNEKLERELAETRLSLLRAQLEPHFLYNALNTVSALVRSGDGAAATDAVAALSALLRQATEAADREWVTVGDEVDFAEQYLRFQRLRFGDRLSFEVEVDESLEGVEMLPLLLQPFLENAVRHGVEKGEGPSRIRLAVGRDGGCLRLRVENEPMSDEGASDGLGVGIANARRRLAARYGDAFTLTGAVDGDRYVTTLLLPVEAPR